MADLSPSELILAKAEAFRQADYGFIYDSYHSESSFRQQFDDREEYIRFGWANLGKDFRILQCRIVKAAVAPPEPRVISYMKIEVNGQNLSYAELTWLQKEEGGWRCHRSQKIETSELPCPLSELDFIDFERIEHKAIF